MVKMNHANLSERFSSSIKDEKQKNNSHVQKLSEKG